MVNYIGAMDTKNGTNQEALAYNRSMLSKGVEGIQCIFVGLPTSNDLDKYTNYIPYGAKISSVEVYVNGARNFFIRERDKVIGYLIVR